MTVAASDITPLAAALPYAAFASRHRTQVRASAEDTWVALVTLRWIDVLTLGRASPPRRGRPPSSRQMVVSALASAGLLEQRAPSYLAVALIGRPWSPDPTAHVRVATLASLADFDEPGWLTYGIEWMLTTPSPGATTLVTRTLCTPTDAGARRRFHAYWLLVRPLGGLLRLAILAAIRRRAETRTHPRNGTDA